MKIFRIVRGWTRSLRSSRIRAAFRSTSNPLRCPDNVLFAVLRGCVLRDSDFEQLQATAPLTASEALEIAAVDRGQGFMCVLHSRNPALLTALSESGFVPDADELGAVDWFGYRRNEREWLNAVAEFQPDWSRSFAAARRIARYGSADAVRFAREHHAPAQEPSGQ